MSPITKKQQAMDNCQRKLSELRKNSLRKFKLYPVCISIPISQAAAPGPRSNRRKKPPRRRRAAAKSQLYPVFTVAQVHSGPSSHVAQVPSCPSSWWPKFTVTQVHSDPSSQWPKVSWPKFPRSSLDMFASYRVFPNPK